MGIVDNMGILGEKKSHGLGTMTFQKKNSLSSHNLERELKYRFYLVVKVILAVTPFKELRFAV